MTASEVKDKPAYASELNTYHRAHRSELKQIMDSGPLLSGGTQFAA